MTAAAAALNVEDEEVDIRRRQPRVQKEIKKSRISYEKKKGLYGYGFIAIWIIGVIYGTQCAILSLLQQQIRPHREE